MKLRKLFFQPKGLDILKQKIRQFELEVVLEGLGGRLQTWSED